MSEIDKRPTAEQRFWNCATASINRRRPNVTWHSAPDYETHCSKDGEQKHFQLIGREEFVTAIQQAESAAYAEGREAGLDEVAVRIHSLIKNAAAQHGATYAIVLSEIRALKRPPDSTPATTAPTPPPSFEDDIRRLAKEQGPGAVEFAEKLLASPPLTESRVREIVLDYLRNGDAAWERINKIADDAIANSYTVQELWRHVAALESPRASSKADAIRKEIVAIVREQFHCYLPSSKCANTVAGWGNELRDLLDRLDEAQKEEA